MALSTERSTGFHPGEPLNMFMVCLKMPDSSSRSPARARQAESILHLAL
jgi:hypothetical protein